MLLQNARVPRAVKLLVVPHGSRRLAFHTRRGLHSPLRQARWLSVDPSLCYLLTIFPPGICSCEYVSRRKLLMCSLYIWILTRPTPVATPRRAFRRGGSASVVSYNVPRSCSDDSGRGCEHRHRVTALLDRHWDWRSPPRSASGDPVAEPPRPAEQNLSLVGLTMRVSFFPTSGVCRSTRSLKAHRHPRAVAANPTRLDGHPTHTRESITHASHGRTPVHRAPGVQARTFKSSSW